MKIQFKKIFACVLAISAAHFSFAIETGGLVSNETKFANAEKDGSLKLNQKNGLNLWFRAPIDEVGKSYFATEGSFRTEYDDSISDSDHKLKLSLDLNLFKLFLQKELDSGNLAFTAGRFFNTDITGLIYKQLSDGVKFSANLPHVDLSLFASYTGLLNAKNVSILEASESDEIDLSEKSKDIYVLANKYFVGALTFTLPHFLASQTFSLEGLTALSLESNKYNRYYATAALNGPIVSPVFYALSSTFAFATYDGSDVVKSNLSKASVLIYPNFKSMSLSLNGLYASGKQGSFEAFRGFTSGTAVISTEEAEYTALVKTGLSATIKPIQTLLFLAGGDLVFDAEESIKYAGFQYSVGLNWQALSDVSLGINFTHYIGDEDFADTIGSTRTQLKINAAIAF